MRSLILRFATTIPCVMLALVVAPTLSLALPFEIDVLQSTYTTYVSTILDGDPRVQTSRTQSSSTPISDYMSNQLNTGTFIDTAKAAAQANAFEVSVNGESGSFTHAFATAQSELIFSPLLNGTANISVNIHLGLEYDFTNGYVSLLDRTSNQQVWNYSWSQLDHGNNNVPWDVPHGSNANFTLDTYFAKDHTYELSMLAGMSSNRDGELADIKLSGLGIHTIPEPSTMLLLGSGLIICIAFARKRFSRIDDESTECITQKS